MKNILSYKKGTSFLGKEIKEWAKYNIENQTSHMKQAKYILEKYSNLKEEEKYIIYTNSPGTGCGEVVDKIGILSEKKLLAY